jgi:L-fucose isomerase-like protein
MPIMRELLALGRPTMIFSAPYSGHEWYELSALRRQELGKRMEGLLTTDYSQLVAAVRPFRAIHHLREAKILNVAESSPADYAEAVKRQFGTEIKQVPRERVLEFYNAVSDQDVQAETGYWLRQAAAVVEPSREEVSKSCRLALAFQKLMDEEEGTVITVDCYGSMWRKLPAYPCIGFTRLNDLGLGGICQSDLPCAMVHVLFQGLSGRPSFVCNPTFDFARDEATLIHCLGSTRMDGPHKPAAPYKLRSIMEREEGAVPQVKMRVGQQITVAILEGPFTLRCFTGRIKGVPETERGCRTKITVKLDGNAERLWQDWTAGIHRVACYGDLSKELRWFCRFLDIKVINEAA